MRAGEHLPVGKFDVYEISEPSVFEKTQKKARFAEPLGLTVSESEFLRKSIDKNRFALIVVADRERKVRIVLTALYRMFRVLLTFSPQNEISTSDLYTICDLHGTIEVSPRAMDIMCQSEKGSLDFSNRISRLLNLDYYLARGTERQRCFHDMIDGAVVFAANAAFLCGAQLTVEPEYPEPIFPTRFDCALLGLLLIEVLSKSAELGETPTYIRFISHRERDPFVDIRLAGELYDREPLAVDIMRRINIPVKLAKNGDGTRILVCPLRPDFSVMELKQRLYLTPTANCAETEDSDAFPK